MLRLYEKSLQRAPGWSDISFVSIIEGNAAAAILLIVLPMLRQLKLPVTSPLMMSELMLIVCVPLSSMREFTIMSLM